MNIARLIDFNFSADERGQMTGAQFGDGLPFQAKRFFMVYAGHRNVTRGGHAHRKHSELLICLSGLANVTVDDRESRRAYVLTSSKCGLYLPPMTWATVEINRRSEVLVLASELFDEDDVIKDLAEFEDAHATS